MIKLVYVLCFVFALTKCQENCDKKGVLLYEDLGCKPIKKEKECPTKFDCGDFSMKPDACMFQGKSYPLQEPINDNLIYPACNVNCYCRNDTDTKPAFNCAILDCPEWLGAPVGVFCMRKYELGKCCSVGEVCPPFDELEKCEVDGKTYYEGQQFTPKDTCLSCVCGKGFKGEYEEPFCRREVCAVQLRHAADLEDHCAPVYFSKDILCCPSDWLCASSDDMIKVINPDSEKTSDLTCKFGNNNLKLGEGIEKSYEKYGKLRNIKCSCETPPLLTCKEY